MAKDTDYNIDEVIETFRRDGSLIREKARVLTEEGLEELYRRMKDGDLPTSTFLDLMKYLAEIGDLKPKQSNTPQQTGPGFSITINIPQEGKPPITIEGTAVDVPNEPSDASDGVMGGDDVRGVGRITLQQLKDLSDAEE